MLLSSLPHTWFIDVDGTILKHNGHKNGGDELLPGVKAFWEQIPKGDTIVLLSARTEAERETTLAFLNKCGLRYDHAFFGLPTGERILINDAKPSGLQTALACVCERDQGLGFLEVTIDLQR